jgi:hypothetical protein
MRFAGPLVAAALLGGFSLAARASEADGSAERAPRLFTPRVVEKTGPPLEISEAGDFSENALRNGVRATREQCDRLGNAVWAVTPEGETACLKYWSAGIVPSASKRVVVFIPGDAWEGAGRTGAPYLRATNESVAESARRWAGQVEAPYIFLSRPGTFGSSGDHMQRRRPAESRLMSSALDVLKQRHGIEEFVIAGYSGGGHVTASLLTLRRDIVCAVPGAAPSSPRLRARLRNWTTDSTGYGDSYEPTEHLRKDAVHPRLRIFVAGDPRDSNGVWPAQVILAEAARAQGIEAHVIETRGTGATFHSGQGDFFRLIAGWCAKDLASADILAKAAGQP